VSFKYSCLISGYFGAQGANCEDADPARIVTGPRSIQCVGKAGCRTSPISGNVPGTTNGIRIYEESANEIVVVAEARASVGPPIRPTINGTITLTFNDAGVVDASKTGNLYPAYEVYQDRAGSTRS